MGRQAINRETGWIMPILRSSLAQDINSRLSHAANTAFGMALVTLTEERIQGLASTRLIKITRSPAGVS